MNPNVVNPNVTDPLQVLVLQHRAEREVLAAIGDFESQTGMCVKRVTLIRKHAKIFNVSFETEVRDAHRLTE